MKKLLPIIITVFQFSCGFNLPEPHSLELPYKEAEQLVQDFHSYKKIKSMDDASRCKKEINDVQISVSNVRVIVEVLQLIVF